MAVLRLPDRIVRDFAGIQRNFEAILAAFPLTAGLLAPDSVTAVELRDDVGTDANRSVTRDHIRNGAVTLEKVNSAVWPTVHLIGLHAARPAAAASNDGFYWTSTDVDGGTTYRSNGGGWVQIAKGVAGGAPPSGAAGGVLSGTYPAPGFAVDMATQAELDAEAAARAAADALHAPLASPTFTGDPKAPTPAPGDNDTSLATTAFVTAAIAAAPAPAPSYASLAKFGVD